MKKITQTKKSNPNAPTGSKANKAYNKMELNVYKKGGTKKPLPKAQPGIEKKKKEERDMFLKNNTIFSPSDTTSSDVIRNRNLYPVGPPKTDTTGVDPNLMKFLNRHMTGQGSLPNRKKGGESKNWIKGAIKRPGAFSAKAEKAGMSTAAYAAKVTKPGSKASTQTKRQANLAKTLGKMRKKK